MKKLTLCLLLAISSSFLMSQSVSAGPMSKHPPAAQNMMFIQET